MIYDKGLYCYRSSGNQAVFEGFWEILKMFNRADHGDSDKRQ